MGRVHWVGGEKGGVGKSFVARLLAQYFIDRAISWVGFDSDRSHPALLRYYSGFAQPLDPRRMGDLDRVVEALDDSVEEVLVDLAAQTEALLEDWLEAGDVAALLRRLEHELWFWYVVDDGKDSVRLLDRFLERHAGDGHIVCVLNHGRGRNFRLFEDAKLRNRIEQLARPEAGQCRLAPLLVVLEGDGHHGRQGVALFVHLPRVRLVAGRHTVDRGAAVELGNGGLAGRARHVDAQHGHAELGVLADPARDLPVAHQLDDGPAFELLGLGGHVPFPL